MAGFVFFHLRLLGRSMRWIGPVLLYATWLIVVLSGSGPAMADGSALFMLHVIVVCWLGVAIGDIDDDAHRDVLTARIGSPARLHTVRALLAAVLAIVIGLATAAIVTVVKEQPDVTTSALFVGLAIVEVAGGFLGAAIAAVIRRPIVRNFGLTAVVGLLAFLGVVLFGPLQRVLNEFDSGNTGLTGWLGLVAVAITVVTVAASARFANYRNK